MFNRCHGYLMFVAIGLGACTSLPPQKPIPSDAPKLATYSKAQIEELAEALLINMNVGDQLRLRIKARLGELLADPGVAAKLDTPGVNAVGAFASVKGGLVVTGVGGDGLVSFAGGRQNVKFDISGFTIGANVGGGKTYGVLLVVGLDHQEKFPDRYKVASTSGTIAETSYMVGRADAERSSHQIHYAGAGIGLSADAGGGFVTLTESE